ncbi:MAG TPA: autotransporter outer membrane beta-barrel domain-containing protein, partial [Trinickia sp.]|nr:autotransporter outer membrane beta-barrel domain-containing protein [Trinickia sp.]
IGKDANGPKLFQLGAAGTLDIGNNQGSFELGAISGSGTVQLTDSGTSASSNLILDGTSAPQTFSGAIEGSGGVIVRGAAGTVQTFSGSRVFGFTGDVTLGSGTLAVAGQAVSSNRFVFDDGANTGGTLDISANGPGGFTLAGVDASNAATTAQIKLGNGSGSATDLVLNGAGNYSFSGTISGYGNVLKQGSGTQTMSGANPFAFTGTTVIADGVLQLRNIADPSQLDHMFELNGGWLDLSDGTFDSSGVSANDWAKLHVTDGSNAAAGGIIGGNDKITLGDNGADSVEAAQIDGGVFVVKTGSNTTTLSGVNGYVGNTRILGGTLKVTDDANLGDTRFEREIVLDGGNLEIGGAGTFASSRQLQLQAAGAVQVDGSASTVATLGSLAGSGQTLTKTGAGALAFTHGGVLGQAIVSDGAFNLQAVTVDATTLAASGQAAIVQATGTTVTLNGSTVASQGDAIVANGTSTLNLSGNTQVTAGGATYRVTSGTGTLNASGQSLIGNVLAANGAGSVLALHLSDNSTYSGTPSLSNGAAATLSIDDTSSWNMTADTTLASLTNLGSISVGGAARSAAAAHASQSPAYQTLTVNGDYQGGGSINLRTELNAGGALADQHTDRLVVTGNVSGQTQLSLTSSGAGANTNTTLNNGAIPTEGISLVQVGGLSSANAFTLKGGYAAAAGSPFQYRVFAYGPGSYALPDPSQSVLPNGQTPQWDYRLQTSYIDSTGNVHPGTPTGGNGHSTLLPQGSSYLTVPLALQNYESIVADNLYRRLGDVRHGAFEPGVKVDDVFARTIDSRSVYHSSRSFADYGYDFGQSVTALQFGADWLHRRSADHDFRLGTAVTLGDSPVHPQAAAAESSKTSISAFSVALTGTWQRKDGWYVDGLFSAGLYRGTVSTSQRGEVGRIHASGFDGSIEMGRAFTLPVVPGGLEVEPHARVLTQLLHFQDRTDGDGVTVGTSDLLAFTGLLGVRMSMLAPGTTSFRPYVRVDFSNTWMNSPSVTMSGQSFDVAKAGTAVQVGVGASGLLTPNLSIYGELSGLQRLGTGTSTLAATLGLRYSF